MNRNAKKSLKRKVIEYQDGEIDEGGRMSKEAKRDTSSSSSSSGFSMLALRRLVPEDWNHLPVPSKQGEENEDSFEKTGDRTVDRGTLWSGKDVCQEPQGISQLHIACNRSAKNSSSCDCETQTYYFVPNSHDARDEASKDKGLVRECCVIGCKYNSEKDSSVSYYGLPSSKAERLLWADILGLDFASAPEDKIQEICSKHFDASVSPQSCLPKVSHAPKSRKRKKRTCDILIAEEAEKVKQSMATGRTKRTPKPNRNYDWAELMPLIKSDTDDYEIETAMSKNPAKNATGPSRRRKQLLDYIKKGKKGNEMPFMEIHVNSDDEMEMSDFEADEYDVGNISLPSLPRAPPPKPKGRPHRIQDTCTQTEGTVYSSKGPLREVKVQCNLTAEPFVTCSSCSSIDWRSLDEELSRIISLIECEIINPILSRCLSNALSEDAKPSHAANVLKMIAGLPRDNFENRKDIHIVSGVDELEEVEIEKFIHQEEGPIVGIREITAKDWNKKAKTVRSIASRRDDDVLDDPDSFGLKEATDKDDDEFNPEYAAGEEDDDDDEEDDDWDIKKEDDPGAFIQKKKTRHKAKKEQNQEASTLKQSRKNLEKAARSHVGQISKQAPSKGGRKKFVVKSYSMKCHVCQEVFDDQLELQKHIKELHENGFFLPPSYQCNDCQETFNDKISLSVHRMFKHGDLRRYQCNQCDYEGPRLYHLKRHLKVHSNERQYHCKECGKGFKSKAAVKNHTAIHTNEGRYKCNICNKAYNSKVVYEDHIRSHNTEKNFECKYCGITFKTYKHVACHIRAVHLNDKRFICDVCGSRHMTGTNLKKHIETHKDIERLPYTHQCMICNSMFRSSKGLISHMKVMHVTMSNSGLSDVLITTTPHPTRRSMGIEYNKVLSAVDEK